MPGGSPEILQSHQTPAAGKKGGNTPTEKEKAEQQKKAEAAVKKKLAEFEMGILYPKKEVLDQATQAQQAKIKSFENKAKDKPISTWNMEELRKATAEMLELDDELLRYDADPEVQGHVRNLATYCFIELVQRPEFEPLEIPDSLKERVQEMQIVPPTMLVKDAAVADAEKIEEVAKKGRKLTPEQARRAWEEYYRQQGKKISDLPWGERQALEMAIRQGIAPESHREIGEVLENADIDEEERISRAQQVLEKILSDEQKNALIAAHNVGVDDIYAGVYAYTKEQIAQKAQILKDAGFSKEERRMLLETGLAGAPITIAATAPAELRRIAEQINLRPEVGDPDREFPSGYLQKQVDRVQGLIDNGALGANPTDPGVVQALNFITTLEERTEAVTQAEQIIAAQREEAREQQRSQNNGAEDPVLTREQVTEEGFNSASYRGVHHDIERIAKEVDDALVGEKLNNNFFAIKITELGQILPNLTGVEEQQGIKLHRELRKLKQKLLAEVATEAQRERGSLYAEIRLRESDKQRILQYALDSDIGKDATPAQKEAWRLLEEEFNIRFAKADVNSSDDWPSALGPGGNTEISEFIATLTNAAQNRTNLKGALLTSDQQERVWRAVRRLKQEEKVREYTHNISYMVNSNAGAEDIIKAATRFPGEELHVVFARPGVAQMLRLYEQAMLEVTAKNGGYLPAKAMITTSEGNYGEVEQLVWELAKNARDMGVLGKGMPDWELRRAIALARGAGIITGRFFEIAAANGLNKNVPLNSFWANGLVKNFAFFEQTMRFDVGQAQNAILGYKLEGGGGPWSTDELKRFKAMTTKELFDTLVNDVDDERLGQMKNPFHIGSIYTQTGWRWAPDKATLASATARLMQYEGKDNGFDGLNPLMGLGLIIERRRGILHGNNKKEAKDAHDAIHHALELAAEISPLKLFNNIISLRQDVLREYYGRGKDGKRKDAEVPRDRKNSLFVEEDRKDFEGQIFIKSEELQSDIAALALVQEELLGRRVKAYQEYLDKMDDYKKAILEGRQAQEPQKPNLHKGGELNQLNFSCLETGVDSKDINRPRDEVLEEQRLQVERVKKLAEHIAHEFHTGGHMGKLMNNLHDKGWKVPWIFGAEDIAHEAFDYEADTGDTIKRRWDADIGPVVQTAGLYGEFIMNLSEFKSQGDIVKSMKKIHSTLSGHDKDVANEAMRYLAEGVGKFYKKDWTARLPFGVGKLQGDLGGQASYAQVAFGRGQMAWDELDMQAFLHHLHASGLMDHHQIEELKVRLGAENYQLAWAMLRSGIPMFLLAFVYLMLTEQLEQAKKAA